MTVHVGVSGWSYARWKGDFYPVGLRPQAQLPYVAARMTAAEVNASFYRLQRPSTYLAWVGATPPQFRLALKGSRYITHLKGLRDCRGALATFLASGMLALGERLGPLLWQLPATHVFDADRVRDFLALLPADTREAAALAEQHDGRRAEVWTTTDAARPMRHVIEARHTSFASPDALDLLRSYGVGLVVSDGAGAFPMLTGVTTDLVYVRLHGPDRLYHGGYDDTLLSTWEARVREWHSAGCEVWVFFDNDADGRAPYDAIALCDRLADLAPAGAEAVVRR